MTSDGSKNNVKTLFFISNSFVFAVGLIWFAYGVGSAVIMGFNVAGAVEGVVGFSIALVAFYGYCGAALEHRKTMNSYSTIMALMEANGILQLVRTRPAARAANHYTDDMTDDEYSFIGLIFVVILALVSFLLGLALSEQFPKDPKEVKNAVIPQKDIPALV